MRKLFLCLLLLLSPIPLQATTVDTSSLDSAHEAGTYPVTLEYVDEDGNQVSTVIYVTIKYRRTVEYVETGEAIDAHDIELTTGTFSQLSDSDLIKLMHARAWNVNTLAPLDVRVLSREQVSSGHFLVTFTTANGSVTSANVIEVDTLAMEGLSRYYGFFYNDVAFFRLLVLVALLLLLLFVFFFVCFRFVFKETDEIREILGE